ncbi:MAG: acetate kinase [Parcubacteria group bacterium]|nr:acetate kinase [Parcubacteria group bacterium]
MEKKYLIINLGSVSKRYAIYNGKEEQLSEHFEKDEMDLVDFENTCEKFIEQTKEESIAGIGLRVVASGSYFREDKIIDDEYLKKLKKVKDRAPLHLSPVIDEIEKLKKLLPSIPMIGVSDSAFHSNLPRHSSIYNIPQDDAKSGDIYKFGYHGIAIQSALRKIQEEEGSIPARIIVAHLGGGASVTAVKDGKSFDTSMGATPLEGLPMSTRVGNIDAGALIELAKEKNMNLDQLNEYLNTKCGLLGISGKTGHIKELFDLKDSGDENAKLALEVFVYNIKKYIGAYTAVLGGLDLLIFSGTISERSSSMREMILDGLQINDIKVIKVNELEEIALKTLNILE